METYQDSPVELRGVFTTGEPRVTGLYTDEWGTFITAYAPLHDAAGKTVAVLCVDMFANDYDKHFLGIRGVIFRARIGAVLMSLVFGLTFFVLRFAMASVMASRDRLAERFGVKR